MIDRESKKSIQKINTSFKVLLVTGPREVGKTTLLKECMPKNMNYVTLDDNTLRAAAQESPKLFLEEHKAPLLIDEVQYAPELFSYIKIKVDNSQDRGQYWLTGSQQFSLMKNVQESLAGRVGIVKLNSFTYSEIKNNHNKAVFDPNNIRESKNNVDVNELFEIIFRGGMPELYDIKTMRRELFFESYITTYLTRDVKDQIAIADIETFRKFMVSVASRNGEQLNYNDISREIGITDKTAKSWLNVLITSGIIYLLEPYMSSKIKRIIHTPKIVFMDTGLCSYLAGWTSARDLQLSSTSGHYLETFIISEIVKSYNALGIEPKISYYRDKEKKEINLIFYNNNKLYPFEIKKSANPTRNMITNFKMLDDIGKEVAPGGIICFYDKLIHIDEKNYAIPISSVINLEKEDK